MTMTTGILCKIAMVKRIKLISQESMSKAIDHLLEGGYWPQTLDTSYAYTRRHDDTDGEFGVDHELTIAFGPEGDAWVVLPQSLKSLRFRASSGGGKSLRVRNALLVLAEAIRRDNEEYPQRNE